MRERAFAKGWQKNTLGARKKSLRKQFSYPQNGKMRGEMRVLNVKNKENSENNLTHLYNIKTK